MVAVFFTPWCSSFSPVGVPVQRHGMMRAENRMSSVLRGGLFGGDGILSGLTEQKTDGPKTVLDIPAGRVKPRPLRFFLQMYILGQQNSKETRAWLPKESDDGGMEVYYKDGTGMCKILLEADSITVQRHGQRPSLEYQLQESLLLHGVLDELNTIAFGDEEDVKEEERLLNLSDDAIDKARASLPARQEK